MSDYVVIFTLNLLVELPVIWFFLRRDASLAAIVITGSLGNGITHPLLHFVLPLWCHHLALALLVGEIVALGFEATLYALVLRPAPRARALVASAGANFLSLAIGTVWTLAATA